MKKVFWILQIWNIIFLKLFNSYFSFCRGFIQSVLLRECIVKWSFRKIEMSNLFIIGTIVMMLILTVFNNKSSLFYNWNLCHWMSDNIFSCLLISYTVHLYYSWTYKILFHSYFLELTLLVYFQKIRIWESANTYIFFFFCKL